MTPPIYSWHPVLTPHQAHTLHGLGEAVGRSVRAIVAKREDDLRRAQGWAANDDRLIRPEVLPDTGWRKRIVEILDGDPDAVHLFGSPFERSRVNAALYGAVKRRRRTFLISEPYSPKAVAYLADGARLSDRLKAGLRPALYTLYGRLLRDRVAGVFAISPLAVEQFVRLGFKVYPFGYFVPDDGVRPDAPTGRALELAYLGSFIERKGIPTLLEAFESAGVRAAGAKLTLFGPASEAVSQIDLPNVRYGGALPFGKVQSVLAGFDLLVVPSLYDGWAVVVNEAVQAGIAVLPSDAVGAGAMVSRWGCGELFETGNADDLARHICAAAVDAGRLAKWREQARVLAPMLDPAVAGAYMGACIRSQIDDTTPPEAPWF